MKKKIQVHTIESKNNELILIVDHQDDLNGLLASGQMLVDSDDLSFIYLLTQDEYVYLSIPKETWKGIKEGIIQAQAVFVSNGTVSILLDNFKEELDYLLENIKGNANYGEEMEKAVEIFFS